MRLTWRSKKPGMAISYSSSSILVHLQGLCGCFSAAGKIEEWYPTWYKNRCAISSPGQRFVVACLSLLPPFPLRNEHVRRIFHAVVGHTGTRDTPTPCPPRPPQRGDVTGTVPGSSTRASSLVLERMLVERAGRDLVDDQSHANSETRYSGPGERHL